MDSEVKWPALILSFPPSACVCPLNRASGMGGLSDGGPIRSFGVLCIVIAASGRFMCLRLCG